MILFFCVVLAQDALAHVLYVDSNASITANCGNLSSPCPTLEAAVNNVSDSVTVHILSSSLTLNRPILCENTTAFHLSGCNPEGTLITCSNTSDKRPGLVCVGLDNVTISNVNISGCGTLRTYVGVPGRQWTYYNTVANNNTYKYIAAIQLHLCKYVTISNLNASYNYGTGVGIVDSVGGTVSISNSHFSNNRLSVQDQSDYYGGTGLGIFVREVTSILHSSTIRVVDCTFANNRASIPGVYSLFNVFNMPHSGTGRGGGVHLVLGYASWNTVEITDCSFYNNTAYMGGGLTVLLYDESSHNHVSIERCVFERNSCMEGVEVGSGGGAHVGFGFKDFEPHNNIILINNSTFRENCAQVGGGMTFFTSRSRQTNTSLFNTLIIDNCLWIGNEAFVGAAVDILPHMLSRAQEGLLPVVVFKDCSFINNHISVCKRDLCQSFGSGALSSSLVNIDFIGFVYFEGNTGSAFVIVNAIANFTLCDAVFVKNTGVQGGAISLIGISALLLGPGRKYTFTDNHATDRGGAIYNYLIDDHDFVASRSCFLYYPQNTIEWSASFNFSGNTAGTYGHSIFSSSIIPCLRVLLEDQKQLSNCQRWNATVTLWLLQAFGFDNTMENQIATEGGYFVATEPLPFDIIPGDEHKLGIMTTDDFGQEIETTFQASIKDDNVHVDETSSCLSDNVIQLKGESGSSGVLLLETVTSRKNAIAMNITLQSCPPGFVLDGNECMCDVNHYARSIMCDLSNFQASIKQGHWAGYIENSAFSIGICPLSFCAYNATAYGREVPLPKVTTPSNLDEYICGPTRTGILCGSCKHDYSVFYHSPSYSCHHSDYCHIGWLFYILSELVPVTGTFLAIVALNINFTSGRISGLILFSQLLDPVVVNGSGVVQYHTIISVLSWGYQLIYGVFTMEFFNIEPLSFCLWEGATVLDVLAFRYVTILYAFLLVLSTLLFLKYRCLFASRYLHISTTQNSIIHGIAAFIVLCYAQATKISMYILLSGNVHGKDGEILTRTVFLSGDTVFYSLDHMPYAVPAIICLLTISTIPPALLLLYPSINKFLTFFRLTHVNIVRRISGLIPINKLKPFLDSFQGCFRDDLRFFAGVYFLYRWIALLMFAIIPTISEFYMSLGNTYILVLMVHTVFQPYASKVHNMIDGCLFGNLALIYSIAGYNYIFSQGLIETSSTQTAYINTTASIQLFLIYLPIVGMAVYLSVLLYRRSTSSKNEGLVPECVDALPPRCSTDNDDLLDGPDEFPARMLQTDYYKHGDLSST